MNAILQFFLFFSTVSLIFLSGILFSFTDPDHRDLEDKVIQGAVVGLALSVVLLAALAAFHMLRVFPLCLAGIILLGSVCAYRFHERAAHPFPSALLFILLATAISRYIPAWRQVLPPGWDPTFHLILAKKILLTQRMPHDWEPFAPIALHYPLGSHYLVAALSSFTHVPLHVIFNWLIPLLGTLAVAQIYVLIKRITQNRDIALLSSAAYAALAIFGSIGYYEWGGLPNLLAMCFFCQALVLFCQPRFGKQDAFWFALFCTAIAVTHHHVMLATFPILAVAAAWSWQKPYVKPACMGALAGSVAILFPYLREISSLGHTGTLSMQEVFFNGSMIVTSLGPLYAVLVAIGLIVYFRDQPSWPYGRLWASAVIILSGFFMIFEYGYRFLSSADFPHATVAFTPSRFLTDLSYFLSLPAGYSVYKIHQRTQWPVLGLAAGLMIASLSISSYWKSLYTPGPSHELIETCQWIEKNTPPDAIILSTYPWVPYLSWRRTLEAPIPASELLAYRDRNALIVQNLLKSGTPNQSARPELLSFAKIPGLQAEYRLLWQSPAGQPVFEVLPRSSKPGLLR